MLCVAFLRQQKSNCEKEYPILFDCHLIDDRLDDGRWMMYMDDVMMDDVYG